MRIFRFVPLLLLVFASLFAAKEGLVGGYGANIDQSAQSMADWYKWVPLKMSRTAANVTISVAYPGLLLKGFYNNRRDSSVMVRCIDMHGDTLNLSVPEETPFWKIPVISKVLQTGTTDSFYLCFQSTNNQ